MRIVQINGGVFGSTGKIMFGIAESAKERGIETKCFSPVTSTNKNREPNFEYEKIGTYHTRRLNVLADRITGHNGCSAHRETRELLGKISDFAPDVLHLHNLHNSYVNLPMLFDFIKKHHLTVVWTLHDCWAFTGHCPHFTMTKCDKWRIGCHHCPQYREYPQSFTDNSKYMYGLKKKWFTGVENMTIVTPSEWLAGLVRESFLKDYPIRVIHNGIDLSVFKPTPSDFREKYAIGDKCIVLGVAFGWGRRKGLDVFIELAKRLDRERYQIVLVGTDDVVDRQIPDSIISIHRTQNQTELAEIYTAADVFVNPTREEVLGLVNIEALACGTPGVTFASGGSPECYDKTCGSVVRTDDIDAMESAITGWKNGKLSGGAVEKHILSFDERKCSDEYLRLYREMVSKGD